MLPRIGRADKLLLGVYLPAYLVVLAFHTHEVARSGLAQLPVFVRAIPGDYPVVAGYPLETDSSGSGLVPGDRPIQLGDRDLRGVGYVGFQAIGLARTRPGQPAPLVFERAGERRSIEIEARPHLFPWARLPLLLLIPCVCALVLVRAPGSAGARRLFLGTVTYAVMQAEFYGGPEWKTWLAAAVFTVAPPLAILTMLHWARRFPDEMPERARVWKGWPWLVMAFWIVGIRGSYLFGWPLPGGWVGRVSMAFHGATLALGAAILVWNYRQAWAPGRRRLRWILLGALVAGIPLVAILSAPLILPGAQGFTRAYSIGSLPMVIWMVGLVLAVVREQAFDVDRLIGATAAWSLAAGAAVATLAVVVPAAASELAQDLALHPLSVQLALAAMLGALAVPFGLRVRPRIDRIFFPGLQALREGIDELLDQLSRCRNADELLGLAASRSAQLFRAEGFALYRREADGHRCSWSEGLALPLEIPFGVPLPRQPVPGNVPPVLRAAGAEILVPIHGEGHVDAFVCLGRKRSGDIYTHTDGSLLLAVAQRVEATAQRFERELADRESRAKTTLMAAASHDLRQPLHAVALLAEALAGRLEDTAARELAQRIGASMQDLDEMLSSLLDRSQLDVGAVRPELERVELHPLLQNLERDFASVAEAKGLELRVASTSLAVASDRLLLARMLRNLVSNAVRYTRAGSVLVGARPRGDRVAIEVRDSGPGIPTEAQREIFEAFHQLPGSTRSGLGLGLSIVDGLARVLGHTVEVRSAPGRGSVFAVGAPRATAAPESPVVVPRTPVLPALAKRILVVDDDGAVRHATLELLRGWGCEVREAADAEQALSIVAGFPPDLVLADDQLGAGTSGTELVARLRSVVGGELAAVILTGQSDGPRIEVIRAAGLQVLRKPVRPARLRALLAAPR